jgi:hypothetical protein
MRRFGPVIALAALAVGCGAAEEAAEVLSPSPSISLSPSPSPAGKPTPSPEGPPAIVVRVPAPGDQVSSPVHISGIADVFEATVTVRVVGEDGVELAAGFTTATCGSGCRGRFSTELFFITERRQDGSVEVFESSAEDGSELHLVSIPVVLVPGG